MPLELGIMGSASCVVTEQDTAKAVGSGGVDVMSTPRLVALMAVSYTHLTLPTT